MPRRVEHYQQPKLAPTAGDLGEEAYQANLSDTAGQDDTHRGDQAGTVPQWKQPQPHNAPPGQHRKDAQEIKLGQDWKIHGT
ncbi:MAG TPA: hypothetical protein VK464_26430 [Symbiobacteriaceae bacterium]|jgi:hypothetical protein|nr:hypothetical protein [Symbiobacteriaceae bacterium]